jgi:hypothetical protein
MKTCAVCGKPLPNRHAVGGECAEEGCEALLCVYHWNRGNRRCPAHGFEETPRAGGARGEGPEQSDLAPRAGVRQAPARETGARAGRGFVWMRWWRAWGMKDQIRKTVDGLQKLGGSARDVWKKLRGIRDPAEARRELEAAVARNREERETARAEAESLLRRIDEARAKAAAAGPAEKKLLADDLRTLVSRFKSAQRSSEILAENERVLSVALGKMKEIEAYAMSGVKADDLEDLIDDIDEAAAEADERLGVFDDLEKAGRRAESDAGEDIFAEADALLGDFEESPAEEERAGPDAGKDPRRRAPRQEAGGDEAE